MDRHWLLQGRLSPPSYRVALLERPALARPQAAGLPHKAVLISAPAGYGKLFELSQASTLDALVGAGLAMMTIRIAQKICGRLRAVDMTL